jgi:hypothetical protein
MEGVLKWNVLEFLLPKLCLGIFPLPKLCAFKCVHLMQIVCI